MDKLNSDGFGVTHIATGFISVVIAVVLSLVMAQGKIGPQGPAGQNGSDGRYGALAGPDIPFTYLKWGGVQEVNASAALTATTTFLCQIQAPPATSTLRLATVRVDSNATGAFTFDVSTSSALSGGYGSSTPAYIKAASVPATADGAPFIWTPDATTTPGTNSGLWGTVSATGQRLDYIRPNEYVTFRIATGTSGTISSFATGQCQASFVTI